MLELRDLGRPERVYREPFESRIEFSQASFGKEHVARRAGRGRSFVWPSLVRVGPEALRIVGDTQGTETTTGMSSPKRYLWDDRWSTRTGASRSATTPRPARSRRSLMAVRRYVNDQGDVISQVEAEEQQGIRRRGQVRQGRHDALALLALIALRLHDRRDRLPGAGADQRSGGAARAAQSDVPRRLRNVILTLPPATPLQEQQIMRSRVEAGIRLIWDLLGRQAGIGAERPQVAINWDEASCTQFVWLYTEITQKFGGQPQAFVETHGQAAAVRRRAGQRAASRARRRSRACGSRASTSAAAPRT